MANAREKVGDALREQSSYAEALTEYRLSLGLAEQLTAKDPSNAGWQKILAASHQRIGITLEAERDNDGALAAFKTCASIPVATALWTPRLLWPPDVNGFCRQKVDELAAAKAR